MKLLNFWMRNVFQTACSIRATPKGFSMPSGTSLPHSGSFIPLDVLGGNEPPSWLRYGNTKSTLATLTECAAVIPLGESS